jgi:hypothetical protein
MTPDDPKQSTKIVNGFFAAVKMGIVVDTLILAESPTKFIERECKSIKAPFSEQA